MAYEYEEVIAMLEYIGDEYKEDKYYRMARQVKEVYAKAKAFDEIVEVFKDYPLKTDSDVMDFIQEKLDDMERE
ncbi:hypothetical protein IDG46_05820 [Staphylococcus sp. EG-SA-13]|nr:hypothetical protein [Staphylococcus sp. EG-SA-13]